MAQPAKTLRHPSHFTFSQLMILTFLRLSYLSVVVLAIIDAITYLGAIQHHVGISPLYLGVAVAIIHLLIRRFFQLSLSNSFAQASIMYVAPVTALIPILATLLELARPYYLNYFLVNFHIHYPAFIPLSCIFLLFGLIHLQGKWFATHWRAIYFYSLIASLLAAGMYYFADPLGYAHLVQEDGPAENLTAIAYFAAAGLTFALSRSTAYWGKNRHLQRLYAMILLASTIGFLLVGGEEISWGQRIFHFATPEAIADSNRQSELNLHNSEVVWPYVYIAYVVIGVYGMFTWIVRWLVEPFLPDKKVVHRSFDLYVPSGYLFINFAIMPIYVWLRFKHGPWKYHSWEELAELYLALGFVTHFGWLAQKVDLFRHWRHRSL